MDGILEKVFYQIKKEQKALLVLQLFNILKW